MHLIKVLVELFAIVAAVFLCIPKLRCAIGWHAERVDATFESTGPTIYGVVCARCHTPRCHINLATPAAPPNMSYIIACKEARAWLEQKTGHPVMAPFIWIS